MQKKIVKRFRFSHVFTGQVIDQLWTSWQKSISTATQISNVWNVGNLESFNFLTLTYLMWAYQLGHITGLIWKAAADAGGLSRPLNYQQV